jgi:hypothetical protein
MNNEGRENVHCSIFNVHFKEGNIENVKGQTAVNDASKTY